ncbi:MAG: hypothetical protein ACOY9Y_08535 [Bacillota bacterium]
MFSGPGIVTLRSSLVLLMVLTHLAKIVFNLNQLNPITYYLAVAAMLACLPAVSRHSRYTSIILLAIGSLLIFKSGAPAALWLKGFGTNLSIISLIVLAPLLGLPLKFSRYLTALDALSNRQMHGKRKYTVAMVMGHGLGALLNIAAIPLANQLLTGGRRELDLPLTKAMIRGYIGAVSWSTSMNPMPLAIYYYGLRYLDVLPAGLAAGITVSLVGAAFWFFTREPGQELPGERGPQAMSPCTRRRLVEVCLMSGMVFALILLIEGLLHWGIFIVVPLVSMFFPLIWALLINRFSEWKELLRANYLTECLPRMKNEIVMFTCAGFFAAAVNLSGLGAKIPGLINQLSASDPWGISLVVALMVIGAAFVGVHPVVTGTAIMTSFNPEAFGISAVFLATVIAGSWSLALIMSPFSGITLTLSGMFDRSPLEVGPKWHWLFVLVALPVLLLLLNFFRLLSFI